MINVRFDLQTVASRRETDRFLARCHLPQVPERGESVSIKGYPYLVISRGWAVDDDGKLYAFLRVVRAGEFVEQTDEPEIADVGITAAVQAERDRCVRLVMAATPFIGDRWASMLAEEIRDDWRATP